jgi:hypothetical protein
MGRRSQNARCRAKGSCAVPVQKRDAESVIGKTFNRDESRSRALKRTSYDDNYLRRRDRG